MSTRTKRRFDAEFKIQAVKLVVEQGYKITEAATNLGIGISTLGKWVRAYQMNSESSTAFPGKGHRANSNSEVKQLEKEIIKLKRERDILKKALGYFAENQE